MDTKEKGRRGEDIALDWLLRRGLRLVERNFRAGHKEIDLIMESDNRLHIVEVKSLTAPTVADPCEKVDWKKQKLLAAAAGHFIRVRHVTKEVQFDIVSIVFDGDSFGLEYLPEAFFPIYYGH